MTKTLFFSGEQPSLPELLRLKVPQQVGANYSTFGIFLLNDRTGSRVQSLKQACLGNPEDVMLRILQEWLEGKGLPVTWESLVQTLRDTNLSTLADEIQASKIPGGGGREGGGDDSESDECTDQQLHHLAEGDRRGGRSQGRGSREEKGGRSKCTLS